MPKLSRDLGTPAYGTGAGPTLNPREAIYATANLGALNAEVGIPVDGCSSLGIQATGTFSATFTVEGSIDGANWVAMPIKQVNAGGTWASGFAAPNMLQAPVGLFRFARVRCSAFTSGAATITIAGENGLSDVVNRTKAADLCVTNTGAAAAAVTLTLPAPATGFYHQIDRIIIERFATTLLTAGATPVLVTTTNLPGTRVFSFPADAAAQGTIFSEVVEPGRPLRSSAAAAATTIVAPATTGVIWRLTADYDIASH